MSKELKYIQIAALLITAVIYLGIKNYPFTKSAASQPASPGFYYISRVVDGDTLKLSSGEKVRLIGVDTPEVYYGDKLLRDSKRSGTDIKTIQSLGAKASRFTKDLCLGKRARLEYDVVKHDKYGRVLAYVYLEDGTFVNAKIAEEGYGQIMTIPPNVKYADYFLKLERQAKDGKKGLWKFK
jgi:micrococcal nuclease